MTLTIFQDTTVKTPAIGIIQLGHVTYLESEDRGAFSLIAYEPKSHDREGGPGKSSSGDLRKYRWNNVHAAIEIKYTKETSMMRVVNIYQANTWMERW